MCFPALGAGHIYSSKSLSELLILVISERVQKLTLTNTSLENHVREVQKRLDEMAKQLEKKETLLESSKGEEFSCHFEKKVVIN